jgi:hypothetical protein
MERKPRSTECEALHDDLAVLAVSALTGHDRARVLAHLEGCSPCTAELEELSAVADALSTAIPELSPPDGFSQRTMAMIRTEHRAPRPTLARRVVSVAAVVILLGIGGGIGAIVASSRHGAPADAVRTASLHSRLGAGGTVVLVSSGRNGWLVMTLHDAPNSGAVTCTVALRNGTRRSIGEFYLAAGYGSWTARLPVAASSVQRVNVVSDGGTVVATARIGASET